MGSELVSDEPTPLKGGSNTTFSCTDIFFEHLPYYLSIGMTYNEFWYGDSLKVKYYRKAQKMREERKNQELWLQGLYVYNAFTSSLGMFGEKGVQPYCEEPIPITLEAIEDRKEREEKREYEENKAKMDALMKGINQNFAGKE